MTSKEFEEKYVKEGKILPNNVEAIKGGLYLSANNITKIENLPEEIEGGLYLSANNITKIENLPEVINGDLSLGYPEVIKGDLRLDDNNITYISPFCLCKRKDILLKYFKEEELKEFTRELI
jgi:hypothetical protein